MACQDRCRPIASPIRQDPGARSAARSWCAEQRSAANAVSAMSRGGARAQRCAEGASGLGEERWSPSAGQRSGARAVQRGPRSCAARGGPPLARPMRRVRGRARPLPGPELAASARINQPPRAEGRDCKGRDRTRSFASRACAEGDERRAGRLGRVGVPGAWQVQPRPAVWSRARMTPARTLPGRVAQAGQTRQAAFLRGSPGGRGDGGISGIRSRPGAGLARRGGGAGVVPRGAGQVPRRVASSASRAPAIGTERRAAGPGPGRASSASLGVASGGARGPAVLTRSPSGSSVGHRRKGPKPPGLDEPQVDEPGGLPVLVVAVRLDPAAVGGLSAPIRSQSFSCSRISSRLDERTVSTMRPSPRSIISHPH